MSFTTISHLTNYEDDTLYVEWMTLDTMDDQLGRTAMTLWDVFGNVGGIQQVVIALAFMIVANFSKLSFIIEATGMMFNIKSSELSFDESEDVGLHVSFREKFKLYAGVCANRRFKKLIEVGEKKLEAQFDLMYLMKMIRHHNTHIRD
jgi:hypothetical protein